jgi:three-Cys-motif partner protein
MATDDPRLFEYDGLPLPEVGKWAIIKHRKIGYYSSLFATSMKRRWKCRVYIDLFASAGKCRLHGSNKIVPGSPLLALSVDDPFDKYVFCEGNPDHMTALQERIRKYFPDRDCSFILGDTNLCLDQLLGAVPKFSRDFKGLTLCFVDPYRKAELDFSTIQVIAERLYVDFLVLIPSYMDIGRNEQIYTRDDNKALDRFLGTDTWRAAWADPKRRPQRFGDFVTNVFCQQMKTLRYIYESPDDLELVKMETGNNLPLYHLGFFSRSELGLRFWRETKKNTNDQLTFW